MVQMPNAPRRNSRMGRLGDGKFWESNGGNRMDNSDKHFSEVPRRVTKSAVFRLIAHLQDPDTGERIIDDPAFRAAANLPTQLPKEKAG
jgi:hypothetical protein